MRTTKDEPRRYGHWTVRPAPAKRPNLGRMAYVPVRCDCGTLSFVQLSDLKHGRSQSCGCVSFPCDGRKR